MLFNLAHSEDTSRSVRRATSRLLLFSRRAHCRFAIQVSTSNLEGHAVLHSIAWLSTESLLRNTRHSWQTWVTFLYSVLLRLPLISLDRTSADRLWHPRLQAPHFGEDLLQCVPIPSLRKILLSRHTHTHTACVDSTAGTSTSKRHAFCKAQKQISCDALVRAEDLPLRLLGQLQALI